MGRISEQIYTDTFERHTMPFNRDATTFVSLGTGDVVTRAARTVTGGTSWVHIGMARELVIQLHADAGTGTSPTLDVRFQTSYDGSDLTAVDVPTGSFTQVGAAASMQIKTVTGTHGFIKVLWIITGTTPSFNFGVYATGRA